MEPVQKKGKFSPGSLQMHEREAIDLHNIAMGYAPALNVMVQRTLLNLLCNNFLFLQRCTILSRVGFAEINWRDLTVSWNQALSANATNVRQYSPRKTATLPTLRHDWILMKEGLLNQWTCFCHLILFLNFLRSVFLLLNLPMRCHWTYPFITLLIIMSTSQWHLEWPPVHQS